MKWMLLFVILFALPLSAAEIAGNWKGTAEGPNGSMERTFAFKVDGDRLTGETVSSMLGKSVIENGKVEGDALSFTIKVRFQDNEMTVNYKGKVTGDTMKLTSDAGSMTMEWTAKRVQ
jgi:hypothetical protein